MRFVRSLIFLALAAVFLLIPVTELMAQVDPGDIDSIHVKPRRIGPNTTGVRVLSWTVTNGGALPDSLKKVTITSANERTYAAKYYQLWAWDNADSSRNLIKTIPTENVPFQTNDKLSFIDCLWPVVPGYVLPDTLYITMDANTAHILSLADVFDTTGIKVKIMEGEMVFAADYDGGGPGLPDTTRNDYVLENTGVCIDRWMGNLDCFEIEFDTKTPACTLLASLIWDGCKLDTLDLGDSIWVRFQDTTCFSHYPALTWEDTIFQGRNFPESIRVDMSHYMTRTGTGPLWIYLKREYHPPDTGWGLRYMIPDSTVRIPIDTVEGLKVVAVFRDSADNYGTYRAAWDIMPQGLPPATRRDSVVVDTKKPVPWDSKSWAHIYNSSGLPTSTDTVISIGDSLSFTIVTTGLNFIPGVREVDSIRAHFYTCGFTEAAKDTLMGDIGNIIVNGNTIWNLKIECEPINCPRDVPKNRDSTLDGASWVVFTAWDNACNVYKDSVFVRRAIDLTAPQPATWMYTNLYDKDQNGCSDLGDSVKVRVSLLEGVTDIVSVYGNHLEAGIGSLLQYNFTEVSDSVWEARVLLVENNPGYAKDDNPLKYIGSATAVYPADPVYVDTVTLVDDAGNKRVVIPLFENGLRKLDTRRPLPVLPDSIAITQLPYGVLKLQWPRNAQDVDAVWFYVYSDSGKGGNVYYPNDPDSAFGSLYDKEPDDCDTAIYNCWTSDPLQHNKTYKFVVRTVDNCGNFEFNQVVITGMADALADKACVVWPTTGGYFGPGKPLTVTAMTTAIDIDFAWAQMRKKDVGGFPGEWIYTDTVQVDGHTTFYVPLLDNGATLPGTTAFFTGDYELFVFTQDYAGNVLSLDSAKTCPAFDFHWNSNPLYVDILSINGAGSPQSPCGYNVWRDSMNTAVVTVTGARTDSAYSVDSWVIYWWDTDPGPGVTYLRDSTRIHFKDNQSLPHTFQFTVNDWPKSNDGVPTWLYVGITDTTNYAFGVDSVELCVPDEVAPDIRMTYPLAYQRVPIAKTSLNAVPLKAKILSTSYDPDSPIRVEFFYSIDDGSNWTKVGETGTPVAGEFTISWNNFGMAEGWVWLKAKVYDEWGNTDESPWIKVWLDPAAPLMKLTVPQAVLIGDDYHISRTLNGGEVDLIAEITDNTVDIAKVEFFASIRDSVDLAKWYHFIGKGVPANNNSVWTFEWKNKPTSVDTIRVVRNFAFDTSLTNNGWFICDSMIVPGDTLYSFCHVETKYMVFPMVCRTDTVLGTLRIDTTWCPTPCGYDYKLRIKVTDIAGNVYDDFNGDGQFDDHTFWAVPYKGPDSLNVPADVSKMLFTLDCGAPEVAISEVTAGERTYPNPSTKLLGPGVVYAKKGETIGVKSVVTDSLNDLGGVRKVDYYFWSPTVTPPNYVWVGSATASPFSVTFDPFALGLIRDEDVQVNEYKSYIKAVLTDSLNQTSFDEITCWMLDTFPGMTKWRDPRNTYVWGDVGLAIWALNGDKLKKIVYQYKSAGGDWNEIETVWRGGLPSSDSLHFKAAWHTLNQITDGSYTLGYAVVDTNDNATNADNNPQLTVIVHNALPTAEITSPSDGAFFCEGEVFTADVTSGIPVDYVNFQYKLVTSTSWDLFPNGPDYDAPWSKYFDKDTTDGFYHVRAVVVNKAGRTGYSPTITLFYDGTDPRVLVTTVNDGATTYDFETGNDYTVQVAKGTKTLTITGYTYDDQSAMGTQSIYNSGIASVSLWFTTSPTGPGGYEMALEKSPADSGHHTFVWDISGLSYGTYRVQMRAYDKAGCGEGSFTWTLEITDQEAPVGLIAGFYAGYVYGVTEYNATVQFQYSTDNGTTWIPIAITSSPVVTSSLARDNYQVTYGLFRVPWVPADGNYLLRLLSADSHGNFDDSFSPRLALTIADGVGTVTSNPAAGFGPGTIEKALEEEECDIEGIARFTSTYGMPFGIGFEYNVYEDSYDWEFIDFRAYPQQGATTKYGGGFDFDELVYDGGWGWGHVIFFDYDGLTAFSSANHFDAYWITKHLGSGGPVTAFDGKVSVDIPTEWTDDWWGGEELLVIWESMLPPTSIYQDYIFTPIGNERGMGYYIGNPGCGGERCGDDEQYAVIKMNYDPTCDLPAESLAVIWWDGEGNWSMEDIYFPSTVDGFDTENHTVEFAATCLNEFFAVVKPTHIGECQEVTRFALEPSCGDYTSGRPRFWYQFHETFYDAIDWDWLEIRIDGDRIYTGSNFGSYGGSSPKGGATSTTLSGSGWEATGWNVEIDDVADRVYFYMDPDYYQLWEEGDLEENYLPPLTCGEHTVYVAVLDMQLRKHCINDVINVDCEKPVVHFANTYVGKNPTIEFSIDDAHSGVAWDSVHVDIFFVTKYDTTMGGSDYATPKERVTFMQTFFPGQLADYMVNDNTCKITTHYELDDERAILVVVYNGTRKSYYNEGEYWGIDPGDYDQFDEFYWSDGGVPDCVGNKATPHVQYLAVDYEAPKISLVSPAGSCPLIFRVVDDGAGFTDAAIQIKENGAEIGGKQSSASAVDEGGEWYYATSGEGGLLYYCPSSGAHYEILVTDGMGNQGSYLGVVQGTLTSGSITNVWAGPNPYDPKTHSQFAINFTLEYGADVTVKIYDMAGDLVRTLSATCQAGTNKIAWNGMTDGNTLVANGGYLGHIEAKQGGNVASAVVKIAVVELK